MLDPETRLVELAAAVADGLQPAWDSLESSASDETERALVRRLRLIAEVARVHASPPGIETSTGLHESILHPHGDGARPGAPAADAGGEPVAWGPLRILEKVGQGRFGHVYRAWDPRLDREVALKLLRHRDTRSDAIDSLVIDEGRLMARVRHPNVAVIYGAERIDGRTGLWMEFVQGRTLEEELREQGAFDPAEIVRVGVELCRALAAVHAAGLVHRDVKAQNVMREAGGRLVLGDFGTGRELDEGEAAGSELAGTPAYLAPEIFGRVPATPQSDLYSLGVLLYHLATGNFPVRGRSLRDIRDAHARGGRTSLRAACPDLPESIAAVIDRALCPDPAGRFSSASELERALLGSLAGNQVEEASPRASVQPSARIGIGRAAAVAAVVLLLLAGVALAVTVAAGAALMSTSWRDKIFGGHGGAPPAQHGSATASAPPSVVVRRVALPGDGSKGRPSTDGELYTVTDSTGNIAVVDLATGQVRRLTNDAVVADKGSQYAEYSAISTDRQFVAYTWYALDRKYELRIVDLEGKRLRVLLGNDSIDYPVPLEWSRDDKWILATLAGSDHSVQLAFVSVDDGTIRPIKDVGSIAPQHVSLSPDSEFIVYDAPQQATASARDLFIIRADGSEERRLVEHPANDASPVWTSDGQHVLFASDRSGTMDLWSIAVDRGYAHGEPEVVHRNMGRFWVDGLTDTGSYFYHATVGAVEVYQADLVDGAIRNPRALPANYSGSNVSSIWSPDGRHVAYVSRRGLIGFDRGSTTLAIRDLQTLGQRELVPALNNFLVRSWSPDGRNILVNGQDARGRSGNWQIDAQTGRVMPVVLAARPSDDVDIRRGEWMPDGRVLFWSISRRALIAHNVQTGGEEVVLDLRAEGVEPIHSIGGRGYKLAPNGQVLAYTSTREGDVSTSSLTIKLLGGGPSHELARVPGPTGILLQDWTPDGTAVLVTRNTTNSNESTLWRVSINGGDPQPLGLSMVGLRDVSVHPDGTKITFTAGWPKNELWVMENFLTAK